MAIEVTVTDAVLFCSDDDRYAGAVEVVEIVPEKGHRTVRMRLRVGNYYVHIPRHRVDEVIEALHAAKRSAAKQYTSILREMNPS
jgi:hypothetical protein